MVLPSVVDDQTWRRELDELRVREKAATMWNSDAEDWQCGGGTSFTSSFTRLDFLDNYDAR